MLFFKKPENPVAEARKQPIIAAALISGCGGVLTLAHCVLAAFPAADVLRAVEWILCGFVYTALLGVALFRSAEYLYPRRPLLGELGANIRFFFMGLCVVVFMSLMSSLIGIVPVAFIDFCGGGLLGGRFNLFDFFKTLWHGMFFGGYIGAYMGVALLFPRVFFKYCNRVIHGALFVSMGGAAIMSYAWSVSWSNLPLLFSYGMVIGLCMALAILPFNFSFKEEKDHV